jgi:hypothetical protein
MWIVYKTKHFSKNIPKKKNRKKIQSRHKTKKFGQKKSIHDLWDNHIFPSEVWVQRAVPATKDIFRTSRRNQAPHIAARMRAGPISDFFCFFYFFIFLFYFYFCSSYSLVYYCKNVNRNWFWKMFTYKKCSKFDFFSKFEKNSDIENVQFWKCSN